MKGFVMFGSKKKKEQAIAAAKALKQAQANTRAAFEARHDQILQVKDAGERLLALEQLTEDIKNEVKLQSKLITSDGMFIGGMMMGVAYLRELPPLCSLPPLFRRR